MSIDIGAYLAANWRGKNCWHIVQRAWIELRGVDLGDRTPERIAKDALIGRFADDVPAFTKLSGPESPSIVLMQRKGVVPHVGVFLRGRVLQLAGDRATFLPLDQAVAGWKDVGFYR